MSAHGLSRGMHVMDMETSKSIWKHTASNSITCLKMLPISSTSSLVAVGLNHEVSESFIAID